MLGFQVVLGEALPNLDGGVADDGILGGIVGSLTTEDTYTDGPFFELIVAAFDGCFHHETQQRLAALAVPEVGTAQDVG